MAKSCGNILLADQMANKLDIPITFYGEPGEL